MAPRRVEHDAANFLSCLIPFQCYGARHGAFPVACITCGKCGSAGPGGQRYASRRYPTGIRDRVSGSFRPGRRNGAAWRLRRGRPSLPGAADSVSSWAPGAADPGNLVLRQVHDVVDRIAAAWPVLRGVVPNAPLHCSQPLATVGAGQRAIISMAVCNSENRSVRLVPAATDPLGVDCFC
jgi:hypothetical protein